MSNVLKCEHLRVVFGGLAAVSDFNIEVGEMRELPVHSKISGFSKT